MKRGGSIIVPVLVGGQARQRRVVPGSSWVQEVVGLQSDRPRPPRVPRSAWVAFLVFLPFPAFHTVYHELAHWTVARLGGFRPTLSYAAVGRGPVDPQQDRYEQLAAQGGAREDPEWRRLHARSLAATAAGPISTMLVGAVGLCGLVWSRRRLGREADLSRASWAWAFLATAWVREALWLPPALLSLIFGLEPANGGRSVDEGRVAWGLGWPPALSLAAVGVLGVAACAAIFCALPAGARRGVGLGALAGAIVGGAAWFLVLGPVLLP